MYNSSHSTVKSVCYKVFNEYGHYSLSNVKYVTCRVSQKPGSAGGGGELHLSVSLFGNFVLNWYQLLLQVIFNVHMWLNCSHTNMIIIMLLLFLFVVFLLVYMYVYWY